MMQDSKTISSESGRVSQVYVDQWTDELQSVLIHEYEAKNHF
jgi:hypothetical protein